MATIHAGTALTAAGWQRDLRLTIGQGAITSVESGPAQRGDERCAILLPAMPNLHSHAFQRGMAGLAERRGPQADSFWSWREVMYRFALSMTPEQVQAVAAQLYVEMLEAGFGRVGEFHYLHHDQDGSAYADLAEMAARIAGAAGETGIALTLLPVFYAHGGFGGAAPGDGQRRFINDLERYARLLEASHKAVAGLGQAVVGVAPHSLRAVTPDELAAVAAMTDGPVHLHIAEQVKEVEDCIAWSSARPVQWLLDHAPVDGRWCLIHATHMTADETRRMAESGAVAGVCPVTEANLGDGIFNGPDFVQHGGSLGIGSDSNVLIGLSDELRQLEYSQRLAHRARNVMAEAGGSTGRALFDAALRGGGQALGAPSFGIALGAPADLVALDGGHPALAGMTDDTILDGWLFAASRPAVDSVWIGGRKLVEGGRHRRRDAIRARFDAAVGALRAA